MKKILLLFFALSLYWACSSDKEQKKEENVQQILPETLAEVTVDTLKTKTFSSEIVSNGQLTSANIAELRFQVAEPIATVYVRNGQFVSKGQKIASLQSFSYDNKLRQAQYEVERTKLELQDILIGQGYKLKDTVTIPKDIMELAAVKSGYSRALNQYRMTQYDTKKMTLTAPINGVVANLKSNKNSIANTGEAFCNIVDMHRMNVAFKVLENELGIIKKGDKVQVTPYAMPDVKMQGRITEINPWVDKDGMLAVKASVNYHKKMVEGMNVKISIFRSLSQQWVVPKTAVVLRTGKQVVFVYKDGKALWNYVTTNLENATEYTITSETLKEGDVIITTGNVNLAHESPVKVIAK